MERKKVAVVHTFPTPYRIPLFERLLNDQELDVRIFFTDRPASLRPGISFGALGSDERVIALPEIGFPPFKRGDDKIRINAGLARVFAWKPDVILIYGYNEPTNLLAIMLCVLHRVPYVLFAEASYVEERSLRRRIFAPFLSQIIRHAACLGPASSSCAAFFRSMGCEDSQMVIVPCLPDVQSIQAMSNEARQRTAETRRKLRVEGKTVLVFIGRFLKCKGLKEMFEALDIARLHQPDVVLVIGGYGLEEKYVKTQCDLRPENSRYFGFVQGVGQLCELFSVADLHLMPSWYEGYGVVCAEALSCGVPSIITRSCGCADVVIDGVNGFIVEPRDPDGLADGILKTISDPDRLAMMKRMANVTVKDLTMDVLYAKLKSLITLASADKNRT